MDSRHQCDLKTVPDTRPRPHPWITHQTCVNYGDAVVSTLAKLLAAKHGGALKAQAPIPPPVLQRILNGVLDSTRISLENAELLKDQGLVDF